jgi:hypothetical protein
MSSVPTDAEIPAHLAPSGNTSSHPHPGFNNGGDSTTTRPSITIQHNSITSECCNFITGIINSCNTRPDFIE